MHTPETSEVVWSMADGQLRNDANAYCHWRNATLPTEVAIDALVCCLHWLVVNSKGDKGIISRKELHTPEISVLHDKVPLSSWSWWLSWLNSRFSSCQAQWEYAARGGLEGMYYPWGDTMWPGCSVWNPYLNTIHPSPVVQGMAMRAKMLANSGRSFPWKMHFAKIWSQHIQNLSDHIGCLGGFPVCIHQGWDLRNSVNSHSQQVTMAHPWCFLQVMFSNAERLTFWCSNFWQDEYLAR